MNRTVRIAAVQAESEITSRERSLERAVELIEEAGGHGAELIAFGETCLPGYPGYHSTAGFDMKRQNASYLEQAVNIGGEETHRLRRAREVKRVPVLGYLARHAYRDL